MAVLAAVIVAVLALSAASIDVEANVEPHAPPHHHAPPHKPCSKGYYPGCVKDDPVFVGSDGQKFYFHGHKDADFCIVSDSNLHVNAHLIGRRAEHMSRDFTWVQSLGILFGDHQFYIGASKVATFDNSVDYLVMSLDATPIILPTVKDAAWSAPHAGLAVTRSQTHNGVVIDVEDQFSLSVLVVPVTESDNIRHCYGITPDNCFAHLELNFQFKALTPSVSGVLGQTYAPGFKHLEKQAAQSMPVLTEESSFLASALMSADCKVANFRGHISSEVTIVDFPQTTCAGGSGLVCRR